MFAGFILAHMGGGSGGLLPLYVLILLYFILLFLALVVPVAILTFFTTKMLMAAFEINGLLSKIFLNWLIPVFCSLMSIVTVSIIWYYWLDYDTILILIPDIWEYFLTVTVLEILLLIKIFFRRRREKKLSKSKAETSNIETCR